MKLQPLNLAFFFFLTTLWQGKAVKPQYPFFLSPQQKPWFFSWEYGFLDSTPYFLASLARCHPVAKF